MAKSARAKSRKRNRKIKIERYYGEKRMANLRAVAERGKQYDKITDLVSNIAKICKKPLKAEPKQEGETSGAAPEFMILGPPDVEIKQEVMSDNGIKPNQNRWRMRQIQKENRLKKKNKSMKKKNKKELKGNKKCVADLTKKERSIKFLDL